MSYQPKDWSPYDGLATRKDGKLYWPGPFGRREKKYFGRHGVGEPLEQAHSIGQHDAHYGRPPNPPFPPHAKRRIKAYHDGYSCEFPEDITNGRHA